MAGVLALRKATLKYILVSMNEFCSIMPDSIIIIIIIIIIKIHNAGSFLPLSLYATILQGHILLVLITKKPQKNKQKTFKS